MAMMNKLLPMLVFLALPSAALAQSFAVSGVRIHTLQPGVAPVEDGVLVVHDGRIACIGAKLEMPVFQHTCVIPPQTQTYAFSGAVLVPGLIEALGRLGQVEIDAEEASQDGVAARESNCAHVQAIDGVQVVSRATEAARRAGVTAVIVRPLGGALIAGKSVAFRSTGETIDDALIRNPVAIHVNIGENAKVAEALVGSRSGQFALLRNLLDRARRIVQAESGPKPTGAAADAVQRLREDPGLMALADLFRTHLPLVVHAQRADDIASALRLQAEFSISLVIAGGAEAHLLAPRLAAAHVPVVLGPVRHRPYEFATRRALPEAAAILQRAGVLLGLAAAETHNARNLRWEAGFAVAAGLPWDAALAAVTRNLADIFGLGSGVGQLRVGDIADFAVFDGDPLSLDGHVRLVVARGHPEADPQQR